MGGFVCRYFDGMADFDRIQLVGIDRVEGEHFKSARPRTGGTANEPAACSTEDKDAKRSGGCEHSPGAAAARQAIEIQPRGDRLGGGGTVACADGVDLRTP